MLARLHVQCTPTRFRVPHLCTLPLRRLAPTFPRLTQRPRHPTAPCAQFWINPVTVVGMLDVLAVPKGEYLLQTAAGSVLGRQMIQVGASLAHRGGRRACRSGQ